MLSQPKNRVQAIKSKFENLGSEPAPVKQSSQLYKLKNDCRNKENSVCPIQYTTKPISVDSDTSGSVGEPAAIRSFIHADVKRSISEPKPLTRQSSDPGKKLHRSHAFRCDRTQKNISPSRSGSYSRSESLKMDRKLSKDRLKRLGDLLDEQMRKENFTLNQVVGEIKEVSESIPLNSVPDKNVPPHILAQYAQVIKPKKEESEVMTDSGVSSETENLEEDKGRVKRISSQFEKTESNLDGMESFAGSSETMKLERKNPNLILTDTLKKALKQPLPAGPPPKKPPRTFIPTIPENEKKDTKRKLEKLEQLLMKRDSNIKRDNIYDIAEENLSFKKPKEVHYLCTEILDITHRTLLPSRNESTLKSCFEKLNCSAVYNSMSSLPYSRLSADIDANLNQPCSCSNNNLNDRIGKCTKCKMNEKHNLFKCHLNCRCRSSEFYVDEHIYDEPCVNDVKSVKSHYGTINVCSKSMEDLRGKQNEDIIYEIPSDYRSSTPDPISPKISKVGFQKLLQNFEKDTITKPSHNIDISTNNDLTKVIHTKNEYKDISNVKKDISKTLDMKLINEMKCMEPVLPKEAQFAKRDRKYPTEVRRHKIERAGYSLKKNPQIDVDRANLNALMNEIYETVTAACNMEENKPGSFPIDQADSASSEESVKLTRSLTEKRKNYVRRVSSRLAYAEPKHIRRNLTTVCSYKPEDTYSTFRSWKSFRESQNNLKMDSDSKFNLTDSTGNILSIKNDFDMSDGSIDAISVDEKAGCVDIELPFEPREQGLFNVCLLVGLNYMTGQAYVKSVFPNQVQVPQHIENLIFPETLSQDKGEWSADASHTQCYSFVLTDERGERSYGYCRRVLPEGATACLPLCYCLIGKYRAPGFYYKILQELESHHGVSEQQINNVLQQLFETDFPCPGEEITLTIESSDSDKHNQCGESDSDKIVDDKSEKLYDLENNNSLRELLISLDGIRIKTISRPLEARAEESSSCCLLDSLGAGLLVKVFGSLLLERKLIVRADTLTTLSSLLEGLQSALYPFVWQQPLISCVPAEITRAVIDAPLPVLAGLLDKQKDLPSVDEGMFIDLSHPSKVLCYQGDESTILPTNSYKTLKTALQMESIKNKDRDDTKTRNVMISEAFLRFFVDILGDFWRFFSLGTLKPGDMGKGDVVFDKEAFIKSATSKQNQFFLEWFTETAMFNHFIQNMSIRYKQTEPQSYKLEPHESLQPHNPLQLIDTPTPNFYDLFEERINSRRVRTTVDRTGYKNALNKRVKLLKARLKDLVG